MKRILVANRGEIALRIIESCRKLGIESVAIFSKHDQNLLYLEAADQAVRLEGETAAETFLNIPQILEIVQKTECDAVHPGYGFLSENPSFVAVIEQVGKIFIGPSTEVLELFGKKDRAREFVSKLSIPTPPGTQDAEVDVEKLAASAEQLGFPLMIKAAAGGGGKGMRLLYRADGLQEALETAKREALAAFGDDGLILERVISPARHIEVQLIGDQFGNVVHLYERDCSLQRRFQKVIEESPAPGISKKVKEKLYQAAVSIGKSAKLSNAATVEFLVPTEDSKETYYFLEVNPRIQVEHPVTEMVTGIDLVELQLRVARGEKLPISQKDISLCGAAVEARLYSEVPTQNFRPDTGRITAVSPSTFLTTESDNESPKNFRIDHSLSAGAKVTTQFDPMLAKLIASGKNRTEAFQKLSSLIENFVLLGVETNAVFLRELLKQSDPLPEKYSTLFLDENLSDLVSPATDIQARMALLCFLIARIEQSDITKDEKNPFSSLTYWRAVDPTSDQEVNIFEPEVLYEISSGALSEPISCSARLSRFCRQKEDFLFSIELDAEETQVRASLQRTNDYIEVSATEDSGDSVTALVSVPGSSTPSFRSADVLLLGKHFRVREQPQSRTKQSDQSEGSITIRSPLPGNVRSIPLEVGAQVASGETLLLLESMKMEHSISSPAEATIAEILVSLDQTVSAGDPLFILSPLG